MATDLKPIPIFPDGRASIFDIYEKLAELETKYRWTKETIYTIAIEGVRVPVFCYLSPKQGESLWLLTGIHGEEPSGPNAVYRNTDLLGKLGQLIPMVVMPLLNPAGYYRNWRFHNVERGVERLNVTDSRHLIAGGDQPNKPILAKPIHEIADITTNYILGLLKRYPPLVYFDLHEDELLSGGYVYSQGVREGKDPVARKTVELLVSEGLPLKMSGATRFAGEKITNGLVTDLEGKRVRDGSIDEFMANETYIKDGKILPKPFARTVIVTETPAGVEFSLAERIKAQEAIIKNLDKLWKLG